MRTYDYGDLGGNDRASWLSPHRYRYYLVIIRAIDGWFDGVMFDAVQDDYGNLVKVQPWT